MPLRQPRVWHGMASAPVGKVLEHVARAIEIGPRIPMHQTHGTEQQRVALQCGQGLCAAAFQLLRHHGRIHARHESSHQFIVGGKDALDHALEVVRPHHVFRPGIDQFNEECDLTSDGATRTR